MKLCEQCIKGERKRTYKPDFLVGNTVYEIKPNALVSHHSVIPKLLAGVEFCQNKGLVFQVMTENDFKLIPISELLLRDDVVWNKGVKK